MRFDLLTDFGLLSSALADPTSMRLAAHVRGVGPGAESSIWIVSGATPPTEVPAPGVLGLLGLAGMAGVRRRR
jgi:MYXO-CTERM domain-containing protein